jgi:hypothetical protein
MMASWATGRPFWYKAVLMELVPQHIFSPGECLVNGGYPVEALPFLKRELEKAENFGTWNSLGVCYKWMGRYDLAIEAFNKVLQMMPGLVNSEHNLGMCYEEMGDFKRAIKHYSFSSAWSGNPNNQFGLAQCLLRERKFDTAEQIWETSRLGKKSAVLMPNVEVWRGQDLSGKKIFISREGGYGDVFWQMRYLRLLKDMGAHVTLQVNERQVEILAGHPWTDAVVADKEPICTQDYDFQVPLWSLMWEFRKLGTPVPMTMDEPYIKVNNPVKHPANSVGLCWAAGEATSIHRKMREIQTEHLQLLADVPVNWVSLIPEGMDPAYPKPDFCTASCPLGWKKTAEFIAGLDLIISADTGIAHLAGAMGKPVWTFLPANSAWFYFKNSEECEWYPSMKLIRNTEAVSFKPVVERIVLDLGQWVADRALWREEVTA